MWAKRSIRVICIANKARSEEKIKHWAGITLRKHVLDRAGLPFTTQETLVLASPCVSFYLSENEGGVETHLK